MFKDRFLKNQINHSSSSKS